MARDYYEALGVPRTADADELQEAYRRLARRYHPDVNKDPAAEERFKEVNEAYHVLADPDTRARYDRFGPDFRRIPEGAERAWAGAGARRPGGGRRAAPDVAPRSTRSRSSSVARASTTSTWRTCSAACSGAGHPGRWPGPTRRPSSS